jgi:tRNA pseudouridine38-40 synthase
LKTTCQADLEDMDTASRRIALLTEYDGTAFNGWQSQAKGRTVQQVMLKALIELTGEAGLILVGCSRTDAGVHAHGHVSHFSSTCKIPCNKLPLALNSHLPPDVSVRAAIEVPADFHAQYNTRGKIYTYSYWPHRSRPALTRTQSCHVPGQFDLDAMRRALPFLLGRHDFSAFMDTGSCDRHPVRELQALTLSPDGYRVILTVQGDGFLYHMVRILAGTLLAVGQGKIDPGSLPEILASCDRKQAGKTMPPQGLCLEQVLYDPPLFPDAWPALTKDRQQAQIMPCDKRR